MTGRKPFPRWPLALIASPAFVAIWSGWVSLGQLCGFGDVQPLPGLVRWHIDTALTLPLGIESYAALALGAWLSGAAGQARAFARNSAIAALVLGALGQVSYHLLAAHHARSAPDLVIVLVACLPVAVLGCAVALIHLLRASVTGDVTESAPAQVSAPVTPRTRSRSASGKRTRGRPSVVTEAEAESEFFSELAAGQVPPLRAIRTRLHVGQARAQALQLHMQTIIARQNANPKT